jgi:cytochrome d ubiquinol oxidase subunit II
MLVVMFVWHLYPGLGFDNGVSNGVPIDLTTASSSPMTLKIMTIAACIVAPIAVIYTLWSYLYVFRRRLSTDNIPLDVTVAA